MFNNYHYFIVFAEELNISKAAKRLFISHQCLSKYLKNLESSYNVTFWERSPRIQLTLAGQTYLETLRKIQFLESNLESQLDDIRLSQKGVIRFGTTEGRYRILIPDLISHFHTLYPDVTLDVQYSISATLRERVLKNELDVVLLNEKDINLTQFDMYPILSERYYIVISDPLLEKFFPDQYPACKQTFLNGVDFRQFQKVPFVMNHRGFRSRETMEDYLQANNLQINCVMELTQHDLHFMMAARDYAAAFCWTMYIPTVDQINKGQNLSHLNIFPIKGLNTINRVVLATAKGKILPAYTKNLIQMIKQNCAAFAHLQKDGPGAAPRLPSEETRRK